MSCFRLSFARPRCPTQNPLGGRQVFRLADIQGSVGLLTLVIVGLAVHTPMRLMAQQLPAVEKVMRLTPPSTIASITVRPKQMASGERMKLAPLEVLTAAGKEHVGFDPLHIERADVLVAFPGPAGPQGGAIVQLTQPFSIQDLNPQLLNGQGLQTEGDFEFWVAADENFVFHQLDPQTIVAGTKIFVKQMLAEQPQPGQISSLLGQIKTAQDVQAIVSISTLQPLLIGMLERPLRDLPPNIAEDITAIIQATNFAAVGANIATEERLQLVMAGEDQAATDVIEERLNNLLKSATETFVSEFKKQFDDPSPTATAVRSYVDRISSVLTTGLTPVRKGNALVLDINEFQNVSVVATLTGLLLPAVQAAREAARRMQSSNNLKQIGLAFHNFESAYRALPAAGGVGDDGKAMLSWRVALLPFVEEAELYEKFHLDEPWDSEHNLTLLEEMPAVYRHPNRVTKPGHTVYQAVVSDKSLLRATDPSRFQEVTDGLSNTILAVETSDEIAVPWTAPQDFAVDEENPGKGLFTNGSTQAAFGDGSVRVLAESIAAEVLNALFTRGGGEVVRVP